MPPVRKKNAETCIRCIDEDDGFNERTRTNES